RSIMTPRTQISWVDIDAEPEAMREQLLQAPHGHVPVCRGSLDQVIGVARAKDLLGDLLEHGRIDEAETVRPPHYVPETTNVIQLIETLRQARGQIVLVNDEFGVLQGLLSPIDLLEAIAGEFPDEDEAPAIQATGPGHWHVAGDADLHQLDQV